MKKIDLHGSNYEDAHREVEKFINDNWGTPEGDLKIITGHSEKMRKVATAVLDRYGVAYKIGGSLNIDRSYIII